MTTLVIGSGKMIGHTNNYWYNNANRAILAKVSNTSGDAYVFIYIMPNRDLPPQPIIFQEVVEMKSMAKDQVSTKDAGAIQQSLSSDGKVALYGIYFDTDKAEIKPESKAQLDEMARMLNANAALKVFVVGHTDSQGAFAHNMELSQKRADAIVSVLTTTYHIAPNRLVAKGVASLSPLAPNTDDPGRAKNRRVELVVQ
jgi:outer membrane protein OmpA-like peptidoglycan-associated protein